jgi:deoxycitidine kinase
VVVVEVAPGIMQQKHRRIFFVEGNIAAGKSTFLDLVAAASAPGAAADAGLCCGEKKTIRVVKEPIDVWARPLGSQDGKSAKSILELFYENKTAHGFAFQADVLITRLLQLMIPPRDSSPGDSTSTAEVVLVERSPWSGRMFAKQMETRGFLTPVQAALHDRWMRMVQDSMVPETSGIVYIRVNPDVCLERTRRRARRGEDPIDEKLLRELHDCHEEFMGEQIIEGKVPVLVLDGNSDDAAPKMVEVVRSWILGSDSGV